MAGDQKAILLCQAGLGSAEETQTGKGVPLHIPQCFQLEFFSYYYSFITLDFLGGGGVKHFKTSGTQKTHREITSLVLFE